MPPFYHEPRSLLFDSVLSLNVKVGSSAKYSSLFSLISLCLTSTALVSLFPYLSRHSSNFLLSGSRSYPYPPLSLAASTSFMPGHGFFSTSLQCEPERHLLVD